MDFKQGDFENILMNAVWNLEDDEADNIDVSEVQAKINNRKNSWAYTTVKTVLDRLVKKEMLERVKVNNKFYYESRISRKEAGINAIEKLAQQYFKGDIEELVRSAQKVQSGMLVG